MKKIYSIICFILIAGIGFAQFANSFDANIQKQKNPVKKSKQVYSNSTKVTTIFSEDFEGGAMPTGWSEQLGSASLGWTFNSDGGSTYFSIPDHTIYAAINDDACNCDMSDVWLITPAIDLSTVSSPVLSFQSFLHSDADLFTLKASIDAGTTWTDVTTFTTADAWTEEMVDLTDYAGESLTLAFHYNDGSAWGYGWAIDDVTVFVPEAHDIGISAISPEFVVSGESTAPVVTIQNFGLNDEATWSVQLTDGGSYNETISDEATVTTGSTYDITFPSWSPADGVQTLTATVTLTDDGESGNDVLASDVYVYEFILAYGANSGGTNSGTFYLGTNVWETMYTNGTSIYGGTYAVDRLYGIDDSGNFGYFDATCETWTSIGATGISGQSFVISMAYDPINATFYTLGLSGSYPSFAINLYTINATTGVGTLVGTSSTSGTLLSIACDNAGNMYGIMHSDSGNGSLYAVNKTDASMTLIGDIGDVVSSYFQSMTFDFDTNICYFQAMGDEGEMSGTYTIDVTTGAPTMITPLAFPSQFTAIGIPYTSTNNENIIVESNINVYPNPANNVITVANAENASIVVLNMVGEVVANIENASANQTIDVSNLADGTYFVRVNSEVFKINVVK